MRTWKQNELEMFERRISPWLQERGYAIDKLRILRPHEKALLSDLVQGRALNVTDAQIRGLVAKLDVMVVGRGGFSVNQVEHFTHEDLLEIFPPQDYLRRF